MGNKKQANNEQATGFFLKLWHSVNDIIDKVGFIRTFLICGMCIIVSFCGYIVTHPEKIFDEFVKYSEYKHSQMVAQRIKKSPIIEGLLHKLQDETQAHRVWIIEAHNGKQNLTGLPFTYGQMTYQVCEDSIRNSAEDYQDFSLDRFPFVSKIIKDGYWAGTVDDLMRIDRALALKILVNETKSLCLVTLYGNNSAIGWLGVSFTSDDGYKTCDLEATVRTKSYDIVRNLDVSRFNE